MEYSHESFEATVNEINNELLKYSEKLTSSTTPREIKQITKNCKVLIAKSKSLIAAERLRIKELRQNFKWEFVEPVYCIVWLDAIHYKVKVDGRVAHKALYNILGINKEGYKEVLWMYFPRARRPIFGCRCWPISTSGAWRIFWLPVPITSKALQMPYWAFFQKPKCNCASSTRYETR